MDIQTFQQRVMARFGDFPTDRDLNVALASLIGDSSAMQTLVALDGDGDKITDEHLVGLVGNLFLRVAEASCVLGVDLEKAMAWGERAAEARALAAQIDVSGLLVSVRGQA